MDDLTPRQKRVLQFIRLCVEQNGFAPTLREIGERLGMRSTNAVSRHVRALELKGYLEREPGKPRTMTPVDLAKETVRVPLVRRLKPGAGLLARSNITKTISAGSGLLGVARRVFAFSLPLDFGSSLGFRAGDTLFLHRPRKPAAGSISVSVDDAGQVFLARHTKNIDHDGGSPDSRAEKRWVGTVIGFYRNVGEHGAD